MKIEAKQSFASRLSLWIVSLGITIFITVIATNYYLSRALLDDYVEKLARAATSSTVDSIESVFDRAETNANSLASVVAIAGTTEEEIHKAIKALLPINVRTFGMAVALEPGTPVMKIMMVAFTTRNTPYEYQVSYCDTTEKQIFRDSSGPGTSNFSTQGASHES